MIVLLIDEARKVTDMQRTVDVEVVVSTFDESPQACSGRRPVMVKKPKD